MPHYVKSSFQRWVDVKREELVTKARELDVPYMKLASDEWAKLTEDDKLEWEAPAKLDSSRYRREWIEYWQKKHPPC